MWNSDVNRIVAYAISAVLVMLAAAPMLAGIARAMRRRTLRRVVVILKDARMDQDDPRAVVAIWEIICTEREIDDAMVLSALMRRLAEESGYVVRHGCVDGVRTDEGPGEGTCSNGKLSTTQSG